MNNELILLIYAKNGIIKAIPESDKEAQDKLEAIGWEQTCKIDAALYIEKLHNDCQNPKKEIETLGIAW